MSEYTNTSTRPVGEIDGYPVKPCMKSGFCCTISPCPFGEMNEQRTACKYLGEPNNIGQRDCLRYDYIVANVPNEYFPPAFGGGCCMAMFNEKRDAVIAKARENGLDEYYIEQNENRTDKT